MVCDGKGSPWNLWLYMMWDNSFSLFISVFHGVDMEMDSQSSLSDLNLRLRWLKTELVYLKSEPSDHKGPRLTTA